MKSNVYKYKLILYLAVEARWKNRRVFVNFGKLVRKDSDWGMQKKVHLHLLTEPSEDPEFILYESGNSLHSITLNLPNLTKYFAIK